MTHRPTSLDRELRALIGAFLKRTGTSARRFGVEALGDPGFMASLDRGGALGLRTVDRLLAFMGLAPLASPGQPTSRSGDTVMVSVIPRMSR